MALLTTTEVAEHFRVDTSTVRRWVADGRLKAIATPGGHHRFDAAEVAAFEAAS